MQDPATIQAARVELTIPRETANDDTVTFLKWKFAEGDLVAINDVVAEIEMSKVRVEIRAKADGVLTRLLLK